MSQLSTAGRLLGALHRESATLADIVASGAGILHERAERARRGEVRLSLSEQLRFAEAITVLAPAHASAAARLRGQVLAARSFESGDLVVRHNEAPVDRWERSAELRR